MATTERRARALWSAAAALAAAAYGVFLIIVAMGVPAGAELTGQFGLQPAVKASVVCFAVSDAMLGISEFALAPKNRGARGADLVDLCHVAAAHHGGPALRPHVRALC